MTSVSKNVYIDKLDDIVNKYNNTYHKTIKIKPADVKHNAYIDFGKEVNNKDPKFQVNDCVRISKCKNVFPKGYTPNGEEILGAFYQKDLQKTNAREFRIEKVIKRKVNKLQVKRKGYDNSFKSWIDKKKKIV